MKTNTDKRIIALQMAQTAELSREPARVGYGAGGGVAGYGAPDPGKQPPATDLIVKRAEAYLAFLEPAPTPKGKKR